MGKNAPVTVVKRVAVTMLGGFRIRVDGNVLTDEINRSQKLWNVLCYLIAHRERTVPQSEFIELFWPEENSANPTNALKTLLYRVRSLLEPLFGEGLEPILSQRGAYAWNPAIACEMDVDRFELLCRRAQDTALPAQKRMALYEEAAEMYRGDYLPKLANQMWVVPISAHYHALYLEAVKEYADLLEHAEKFETMAELCTRASQLDPLDESLHTLIVRALLRQGKDSAALSHYEKATDLLYRNLGVRPSEELRALYREIMDVEERLETNLEVIQANLREAASGPGPLCASTASLRRPTGWRPAVPPAAGPAYISRWSPSPCPTVEFRPWACSTPPWTSCWRCWCTTCAGGTWSPSTAAPNTSSCCRRPILKIPPWS